MGRKQINSFVNKAVMADVCIDAVPLHLQGVLKKDGRYYALPIIISNGDGSHYSVDLLIRAKEFIRISLLEAK